MTAYPQHMTTERLEDAVKALLLKAEIDGVTPYTAAETSVGKLAENRVEIIAGDAEAEFPEAPTSDQAAANIIVPLLLRIVTSAKPIDSGGVETEPSRGKHTLIRGQVLDALLRDDLSAALMAEEDGLHVGMISWARWGAPVVANGETTSEIEWEAHICAK